MALSKGLQKTDLSHHDGYKLHPILPDPQYHSFHMVQIAPVLNQNCKGNSSFVGIKKHSRLIVKVLANIVEAFYFYQF